MRMSFRSEKEGAVLEGEGDVARYQWYKSLAPRLSREAKVDGRVDKYSVELGKGCRSRIRRAALLSISPSRTARRPPSSGEW